MTPLIQTITMPNEDGLMGNCWQAAIASILDLPLDEVPHFVQIDEEGGCDWWVHTQEWLSKRGLCLYDLNGHLYNDELYFVSGMSPRGYMHVTIYKNGKMIHDPHPHGTGLLDEKEFEIIRPRP